MLNIFLLTIAEESSCFNKGDDIEFILCAMILGGIIGIFIGYVLADTLKNHSETLLRYLNPLCDHHEGRFTLADLTLETQIHPTKVIKHLNQIQELTICLGLTGVISARNRRKSLTLKVRI